MFTRQIPIEYEYILIRSL